MKTVGSSLEAKGHFQRPLFAWLLRVFWLSAALSQPCRGASFLPTGSMTVGRFDHTATLLPNGKVLLVGGTGTNQNALATVELFDPSLRTWSAANPLNQARSLHTATLLTSGLVLVVGGADDTTYLASAEEYDPASGLWSSTGPLNNARGYATATLLPNGKLLAAVGYNGDLFDAELYDPCSGIWSANITVNHSRLGPTATLLANGKVLLAGGFDFCTPPPLSRPHF